MTEYIDKSKAINAVFEAFADGRSAYVALEAMPAADVAPVRRGKWERYRQGLPVPENGSRQTHIVVYCDWFRCSECGVGFEAKTFYCPNCGAKMDLE